MIGAPVCTHKWTTIQSQKRWDSVICNNIDGPGGHYIKQNKSDTEGWTLHNLTHMQNLQWFYLIDVESRIVVTIKWGKEVAVGQHI
jgi:hypothetical protein